MKDRTKGIYKMISMQYKPFEEYLLDLLKDNEEVIKRYKGLSFAQKITVLDTVANRLLKESEEERRYK